MVLTGCVSKRVMKIPNFVDVICDWSQGEMSAAAVFEDGKQTWMAANTRGNLLTEPVGGGKPEFFFSY